MDNLALPPEVLTLTHQLEAAKLEEANTQLEACRRENELLKGRLEKSERDTHEFVAFFQREVGGKDTLLKKAQKRVEELEQLREKENKAHEKKYRERERELTTELNALQESSSKEITFLKDDLRRFKNFKNARDELEDEKNECDRGVPSCCGAFTSLDGLVSISRCRGWFLFRY